MQITLKPDVRDKIVALSAQDDRKPTNLVNKILADYIAEREKQGKKKP